MANTTIGFGIVLLVLGIGGYYGTGGVSPTALIPAGFGLLLVILGIVARDPGKTKHAMHFAAVLGVLGFLGSAPGLMKLGPLMAGQPVDRQNAVMAQAGMAILMLLFTAMCVRSFISARRNRTV